jgi:hypothetical protein
MAKKNSPLIIAGKIVSVIAILAVIAIVVATVVALIWSAVENITMLEVYQTWFNCLPAAEEATEEVGEVVTSMLRI